MIDQRSRPLGISILALIAAASALLGAAALAMAVSSGGAGDGVAYLFGWLLVFVNVALFYGFWTLRPWAWSFGAVVWLLGFVDALRLVTTGAFNTNLVVAPLVLLYLFNPGVKRTFGR